MTVGSQMPEYKLGSQNSPYKLGLKDLRNTHVITHLLIKTIQVSAGKMHSRYV